MSGEKRKTPDVPSKEIYVGMDIQDSDDSSHYDITLTGIGSPIAEAKGHTFGEAKVPASKIEDAFVASGGGACKDPKEYVMRKYLGGGAQGSVYTCADPTSPEDTCAVKVVTIPFYKWGETPKQREQRIKDSEEALQREIKNNEILHNTSDPSFTVSFHTVHIISKGKVVRGRSVKFSEKIDEEKGEERPGEPFYSQTLLFMRRFDNTLLNFLQRCAVKEDEMKVLFDDICKACARMHQQGMVNRDIKLENIGLLLLIDRLVARIADHGHGKVGEKSKLTKGLSGNTVFRGTAGYLAPECGLPQGGFHLIDSIKVFYLYQKDLFKIDVYAAGVVLYAMLTRRPLIRNEYHPWAPKEGISEQKTEEWRKNHRARIQLGSKVIRRVEQDKDLSDKSKILLKKMLAVDPKDRFATFDDVLKDDWFNMTEDDRKKATQSLIQKFGKYAPEAKKRVATQKKQCEDACAGGAVAMKYDTGGGVGEGTDETSETTDSEGASKTTDKKIYETSGPPPDDSTFDPDTPTYRNLDSNTTSLESSTSTTRSLRSSDSRGLTPSSSTTRSLKSPIVELVSKHYVILPAREPFPWNEALDTVCAAMDMELIEKIINLRVDKKSIKKILLVFRSDNESIMVNVNFAKAQSDNFALLFELAWGRRDTFLSFLDKAKKSFARAS